MTPPLPRTWREVLNHPGILRIEDERANSRHRNLDLFVWIFLHKNWTNPVTKEKGGRFLVRTIWELREYWPDIQKA